MLYLYSIIPSLRLFQLVHVPWCSSQSFFVRSDQQTAQSAKRSSKMGNAEQLFVVVDRLTYRLAIGFPVSVVSYDFGCHALLLDLVDRRAVLHVPSRLLWCLVPATPYPTRCTSTLK